MTAICVHCIHSKDFEELRCDNDDLPISDFVLGVRLCRDLNSKGDCKGFSATPPYESIYESKKDEDLANTANESPWEPENACVEHKP